MTRRAGWTVSALADALLAGGARLIQVRCKTAGSAEFLAVAEDVVARARAAGASVIVNDRADIAKLSGADGVHVGQEDLEPAAARRILGGSAVIGLSTHTTEQLRAALAEPVDYVAMGPVFATRTKDTGYAAVGTDMVRDAAAFVRGALQPRPLVAIGGITLDRAREVLDSGATSVAVISDLIATGDPRGRVRDYLQVLGISG